MAMNSVRILLCSVALHAVASAQAVWSQRSSGGVSARSGHAIAFDAQHGRSVLFGGSSASGYSGDTWEWNGTAWLQAGSSGTGPQARDGHAMAYDSQRARLVLFGGSNGVKRVWISP